MCRKLEMAPNRMFQQLTDKTKKKHRPFYEAVDAHARRRLISFRAEHSDADRDITGIEGLLFRNRLN